MIKILLDPQIFIAQKFGGISRSYTEIYDQLEQNDEVEVNCPIFYTENIHFKEKMLSQNSFQERNRFLIKYHKLFRNYAPKRLNKRTLNTVKEKLNKEPVDVFIPTYYDPYFLDQLGNIPFVLTVYDMIHELFPQYFGGDLFIAPNKKLLMEKATKIIAISNSTKNDILQIYPHINPDKIEVVYIAHALIPETDVAVELPEYYILFIGNRSLYKNFNFFIEAVTPLLKKSPDLYIMCAGGNAFDEQELQLLEKLQIVNQVIQRNFEDPELGAYYKNAKCFVFPSQYEGFGIPVLEAMACGCPVVLAHHSSLPEVAGEAGVYFNLNDAKDLQAKITLLLEDETERQSYVSKGLDRSKLFNWNKTTLACLEVYKKAISSKKN